MKRIAFAISAAMVVNGFGLISANAADPNAPVGAPAAQTDNQLNRARDNSNNANNNAGAAVNNGTADRTDNNGQTTGDKVRTSIEHATAGNPSANNPAPDAKDIRKTLGKVTEAALTKGGMNKLVSHFVDADRNRIKNSDTYSEDFGQQLDGRIQQINEMWKTKYGHEFKVKSAEDVYQNFATIQQGENGRDAALASDVERNSQNANMADRKNAAGNDRKDENLEPGRQMARVIVRGTMNGAEIDVPMIHELPDSWTINVPDTLNAAKLRQNLLDHLTAFGDTSANWPADENVAAQEATRHVLMAVLDQPVPSNNAGSMNRGGMAK
jgi:hypothetical protein